MINVVTRVLVERAGGRIPDWREIDEGSFEFVDERGTMAGN